MEYNKYFSLIIIISSISGILLGVFTNNINDSNEINNDAKYTINASDKNIETQKDEDKNEKKKEKENNMDTTKENEKGKEIKEDEEETDGKNKEEEKKEKNENNKQKNENEKDNSIGTEKIIEEHDKFTGNKTIIAVSYATDNKYIYPTIVAMTS